MLLKVQSDTYIKIRSSSTRKSKKLEKGFIRDIMDKYSNNHIRRYNFVKEMCFKFLPYQYRIYKNDGNNLQNLI